MPAEHERQEIRRAKYLVRTGRAEELDQHLNECIERAVRIDDMELARWAWQICAEREARQ